jgi:hypothetical protein
LSVKLTDDERSLLRDGLVHWSGPAKLSAGIAALFELESIEVLQHTFDEIDELLVANSTLDRSQLRTAILATELMFASDMVGAGVEWETVTGRSDAETLKLLRPLQIGYYTG